MREHAHDPAASTASHADHAHATTPGRSTLLEHGDGGGHGGSYRGGSIFDAFKAKSGPKDDSLDVNDVNSVEAAAASTTGAADDDEGADDRALLDHGDNSKKHPATKGHDRGGGVHIITRGGLRHLRHAGKEGRHAANLLYNNPNAYIVLKQGQTIPRGWKANPTILFPSYHEFEAAHKGGKIPAGTKAVVYDNEHWAQTPQEEKTHAVHYAKLFGELAHKLGLTFIAAPTEKWFKADARFADIIDLQLQGREVNTKAYAHAVKKDVNFAHKHNPGELVVGQISSNRNHLDPDHSGNIGDGIDAAESDILDNAKYLDGFWGYLYQQNHRSVRAGQRIMKDFARKEEHGADI